MKILNILITSKGWGPIDQEKCDELDKKNSIFECGICSEETKVKVYHNLIGEHWHIDLLSKEQSQKIKDKIIELIK